MADYSKLIALIEENGNLSLSCRITGIAKGTFLNAVDNDSVLADQYARAKERGIDSMMEELLDADITDPAVSRLEWDRKRWHASKLFAKRYGEKVKHVGGDAGDPAIKLEVTEVEWTIVDPANPDAT